MLSSIFRGPVLFVSSFGGLGYLPTWHRHWPAFLAIVIALIVAAFNPFFSGKSLYQVLYGSPEASMVAFCSGAMIAAFYTGVLCLIFGPIFIGVYDESSENLVIDVVCSQLIILALTGAGILGISDGVRSLVEGICTKYIYCPYWFYATVMLMIIFSTPLFVARFFDAMEFWPAAYLRVRYGHRSIPHFLSTMSGAFYSIMSIYLVAFIMHDINTLSVASFLQAVWGNLALHLYWLWDCISVFFGPNGILYSWLESMGLVDWLSSMGS